MEGRCRQFRPLATRLHRLHLQHLPLGTRSSASLCASSRSYGGHVFKVGLDLARAEATHVLRYQSPCRTWYAMIWSSTFRPRAACRRPRPALFTSSITMQARDASTARLRPTLRRWVAMRQH